MFYESQRTKSHNERDSSPTLFPWRCFAASCLGKIGHMLNVEKIVIRKGDVSVPESPKTSTSKLAMSSEVLRR